ncbi:MAG: TfoX/Sxy family protein [Bacteroidales bacterium]|nr:TfoX/Sxy family protein [Bacteroidales bacterium]
MACNTNIVQYITDQCSAAGDISTRKMFGDYGLYCNSLIVGLICDNRLYLKPTDAARPLLRSVDMRPPYEGAKEYLYIDDIDDHDYLAKLVATTYHALSAAKKK